MIVIKVGGGKTVNWNYIAKDVSGLHKKEDVIIVHGASALRDEIAKKLGSPTKTVMSPSGITSVYTDRKALEIFLMVYSGLVNKQIVAEFLKNGIPAVGLSGVDAKLWEAKPKKELLVKIGKKIKLIKDNKTGRVEKINTGLVKLLLKNGYVPVISAPAISYENEIVNTDNDWGAAVTAAMLGAEKLVYLFEAAGLLKNIDNPSTVIRRISTKKLYQYLDVAQGRMKKKILAAQKALDSGVKTIYFGDGRVTNPVTSALKGKGTIIQ